MNCFRNFSASHWTLFAGNLLFLFFSLFYLAWWTVSFGPNSSGESIGGALLTATLLTGVIAIALIASGVNSLAQYSTFIPVKWILLGCAALFIVQLLVTSTVFHRMVTSELMILHLWTALELSAVAVLFGTGRFGTKRTIVLTALVGIATIVASVCYVLFYQLDPTSSFWDGMIPLIVDAFVMLVFLVVFTVS